MFFLAKDSPLAGKIKFEKILSFYRPLAECENELLIYGIFLVAILTSPEKVP
jgi:hypothetical protein